VETTLQRSSDKQIPPYGQNDKDHSYGQSDEQYFWAAGSATIGAAAWAGTAVAARAGIARIGAVGLIFLFAPLVAVPLGMALARVISGSGWCDSAASRLQPLGAALAAMAMWLPPGRNAGLAALGWMLVCVLLAGGGLVELIRTPWLDADRACPFGRLRAGSEPVYGSVRATLAVAKIDLAVGGVWLVASRLGMRPMGIQEPIGLLTAVHFHFAGFATATIAAATLLSAEKRQRRWLKRVVGLIVGLPYVVAAGFMISPALKMGAALMFSASVAVLALFLRHCGKRAHDATARVLLQVAPAAVFAGMVLSGTYAMADLLGSDVLTIPQMARTHGILNAVGFCMLGLLGWLVENSSQLPPSNRNNPALGNPGHRLFGRIDPTSGFIFQQKGIGYDARAGERGNFGRCTRGRSKENLGDTDGAAADHQAGLAVSSVDVGGGFLGAAWRHPSGRVGGAACAGGGEFVADGARGHAVA